MTCRGRHWFKQVSERKCGGNLNGNRIAKSLSIVQCMCDIQPMPPNQCSSAELKKSTWRNHMSAMDHWSTKIAFLFLQSLVSSVVLQNKARLLNTLNWQKTIWFCDLNSSSWFSANPEIKSRKSWGERRNEKIIWMLKLILYLALRTNTNWTVEGKTQTKILLIWCSLSTCTSKGSSTFLHSKVHDYTCETKKKLKRLNFLIKLITGAAVD